MSRPPSSAEIHQPIYSPAQIREVYERLNLPLKFRYQPGDFSKEIIQHRDGIGFLSALVRHSLASFPFENLDLHYSMYHQTLIDAGAIYDKLLGSGNGRGGYGVETNMFFNTLLRSAGFDVIMVGARVSSRAQPSRGRKADNSPDMYGGWTHMVNLVTLRNETYLVDIGFGPNGPTRPLPLMQGTVVMNAPPNQNVRLRFDKIAQHADQKNKLWLYEQRVAGGNDEPWLPIYAFPAAIEFLAQDFEVINHFNSTHPTSYFTYRVICSKAILNTAADQIIGETVMVDRRVIRRQEGREELLAELESEQDRINALDKYFGVKLTAVQQLGIRDRATWLGE